MEIVKVRNTSPDKPLILRHDISGDITIAPDSERIVPLVYATLAFGNPGARNEGKNNVRDAEYAMARTLWGFYPGIDAEADWAEIGPSFEVYDMDDNRIYMVLDDPTGEYAAAATGLNLTDKSEDALVADRITSLERQIENLTRLLAGKATDTAVPVPETPAVTAGADPVVDPATTNTPDEQTARNEQRDELPKPASAQVKKDSPRSTRVGGK